VAHLCSLPGLTGPALKGVRVAGKDTRRRHARTVSSTSREGYPERTTSEGSDMQDWMIVLLIGGVVIFGAAKLPQIARNMGKAQGEFKKGLKEGVVDDESTTPPAAAPPAATPPAAAPPAAAPEQAQRTEGDTPSA